MLTPQTRACSAHNNQIPQSAVTTSPHRHDQNLMPNASCPRKPTKTNLNPKAHQLPVAPDTSHHHAKQSSPTSKPREPRSHRHPSAATSPRSNQHPSNQDQATDQHNPSAESQASDHGSPASHRSAHKSKSQTYQLHLHYPTPEPKPRQAQAHQHHPSAQYETDAWATSDQHQPDHHQNHLHQNHHQQPATHKTRSPAPHTADHAAHQKTSGHSQPSHSEH